MARAWSHGQVEARDGGTGKGRWKYHGQSRFIRALGVTDTTVAALAAKTLRQNLVKILMLLSPTLSCASKAVVCGGVDIKRREPAA